jgi:hypothetical protein
MKRALGLVAAAIAGAIGPTVLYFFSYVAGMRYFSSLRPPPSEFWSVESFAVYGLCGFPVFMAAGGAFGVWAFVRLVAHPSESDQARPEHRRS